jgi:hypothetical protein
MKRFGSPTLTIKQKLAMAKGANRKKPGFSSVFSIVMMAQDKELQEDCVLH